MFLRRDRPRQGTRLRAGAAIAVAALLALSLAIPGAASAASGELDCNGHSPIQHAVRMSMACTDIRGFSNHHNQNTWNGRFYDNGYYIGHDEPDLTFLSHAPGSGNNVTWTETLPRDPSSAPTVNNPGSDVSHWFELSVAPWYSMAICDAKSYPQSACTPQSDANAPVGKFNGGGSAFMELQLYPPGFAPFADAISCDNTHWCSALNIDSLACTFGFARCNTKCEEPVNFAFIQRDGVPAGPPSPQRTDLATFTPNPRTLLMNPGDRIRVHMFDAPVPGGGAAKAFEVVITDFTTGQRGYMQASADNGFQNTSIADCSGTPHNFQPEYNTAIKRNIIPWAALATNISTQYETGHWTPCTRLSHPGSQTEGPFTDTFYNTCSGPYEAGGDSGSAESTDAPCYPVGDTHGGLNAAPDQTTGCANFTAGGDLDFDGSPYWPEWPVSASPTQLYPSSFVEQMPLSNGTKYSKYFIQTDLALSESTCNAVTTVGCFVPPPNAPGGFYPYWSRVNTDSGCLIEFGNVSSGQGVNNLGKDTQYGTDQSPVLGYPEFEGPVLPNTCKTTT